MPVQEWPRQRIIEAFQDFYKEHDHLPRTKDLRTPKKKQNGVVLPNYMTVCIRFGSIAAAAKAAGHEKDFHSRTRNDWTTDKVKKAMKKWYREHGKPPTLADFRESPDLPSYSVMRARLGSKENAHLASGIPLSRNIQGQRRWSREAAITAAKDFVRAHGRMPKVTEKDPDIKLPSYPVIQSLFGGMVEWAKAAGVEPRYPGNHVKDE